MGVHVDKVTIDTNDLATATAFWQGVTGYEVGYSSDGYAELLDPQKLHVGLSFQVVPEPRVGKNRLHFDLTADDLEREVTRVAGLGASEVTRYSEDGADWVVMTDTDGNQFCIVAV
jgi:catechol 2,3-dioxygenase-like lactoylglutathione lyase family enzyme